MRERAKRDWLRENQREKERETLFSIVVGVVVVRVGKRATRAEPLRGETVSRRTKNSAQNKKRK